MPTWIDFKELRSKLKFEDVLVHYGVEIKRRGDQHLGFCPLPGHTGNKNSPSFSANLARGIFHCFGCGAKGNVLDFAVLMSGESIEDGRALKRTAVELRSKFFPEDAARPSAKKAKEKKETGPDQLELAPAINPALDFELQGLDPSHPYLAERGLVKETIARFGLGYCSRGSLTDRIAIPLHDSAGKLIGYAGRVVDDATITEENPRYLFPAKRVREGHLIEFRKTLFLYNGYRLTERSEELIVVEGFASVWWLTQNGFGRVVATMGSECSEEQAELIVKLATPDAHVWIMPDGDKAGERFAQSLLMQISPRRYVRWAKLVQDCQPTDLPAAQLKRCLSE